MRKIQNFRWVCFFAIFLALVSISEASSAGTIYVSSGESIQAAVDRALPGDTVLVNPGRYNESIKINQDNLTIISDPRELYNTVITGKDSESNVFRVAASNVTISGFSIADGKCGIYLYGVQNCTINNNNISGNNIGICLFKSDSNTLSDNLVSSNADCGIRLFISSGNMIYNNYFNNLNNVRDDKSNLWNLSSGNYWSDYAGKDENGDGIGDTVYAINRRTKSVDYRPLTDSIPQIPILPEAIFTSNVTVGYAPLTVDFTDLSENTSSLLWSFEKLGTSNSSDFLHTFVNEGNYTVTLNVTNENGSDSTGVTVSVLKAPDSSVPVFPEAKFSANVTDGHVPLTVQFSDFSKNAASLSWSFGDGKNSHCKDPIHTFCCPGNYTVSLTAENENGSSSTCIVITALGPTNQSSTGDSTGSGEAGGPGSDRRNLSTCIEKIPGMKGLDSLGDFVLSFTGTRSFAGLGPVVEYRIFRLADTAKALTEYSFPGVEVRKISMHVLFLGFLAIALGLSVLRKGRK